MVMSTKRGGSRRPSIFKLTDLHHLRSGGVCVFYTRLRLCVKLGGELREDSNREATRGFYMRRNTWTSGLQENTEKLGEPRR